MMTLEEAFGWYEATRSQLGLFSRLGRKHREKFPPDSPLWKDEKFKHLDAGDIEERSRLGLEPLADFAVLILFSASERTVRDRVLSRAALDRERIAAESNLIVWLIDASLRDLKEAGFAQILDLLRNVGSGLAEEVSQVRRYRNWVAHGRASGDREEAVTPEMAYDRLRRFLEALPEA